MEKNFKLAVNNSITFEFSESNLQNLDAVQVEPSNFHILNHNQPYLATITSADFLQKKYQLI